MKPVVLVAGSAVGLAGSVLTHRDATRRGVDRPWTWVVLVGFAFLAGPLVASELLVSLLWRTTGAYYPLYHLAAVLAAGLVVGTVAFRRYRRSVASG